MYNNPYNYNPQVNIDRINNQIAELERMKAQIPQQMQPAINQTFQLAPTNREVIRYANSIDEVQKEMVIGDTPYFSKDLTIVWIKNIKGEIRSFELNEIIAKDNKDLMIENLQLQIKELRKEIKNANTTNEYVDDTVEDEKSTNVSTISKSTKKQK
jgi:hypothetical protein